MEASCRWAWSGIILASPSGHNLAFPPVMDFSLALFWAKKLVALAILPPVGPLLLVAVGLALAGRSPRWGRRLAWLGWGLAIALTLPMVVGLLLRPLEATPPVTPEAMRRAQAIVILGGGQRRHAPEFGGPTLNCLSLERVRYGARLARRSGLPILVTGGAPTGEVPEAALMADALDQDFGLRARWQETASRDTRENARFSAVQLQAAGVRSIALVTHAAHMPRAVGEFEAAGFQVIPAPTAWLGGPDLAESVLDVLPSAQSAYAGWFAVHEWLGRLAYALSR